MSSVQKFVSGARKDPEVAFSFEIYTQSTILPRGQVGFSEVSGLRSVTNVIEHKKGNETFIRKIFGRTTVENITARHGLDNGDFLSQWYRQVKEDEVQLANGVPVPDPRQTVVIEQMARGAGQAEGHVIKRWLLHSAWPCALEISDFRGDADEVTIESLEICYEILEEENLAQRNPLE